MDAEGLSTRIVAEVEWFRKRFARQLENLGPVGGSTIDMATAENWLVRQDLIDPIRRVALSFKPADLSYTSGLGGSKTTLQAAAKFFNHFFEPARPIKPLEIVAGPGASSLLDTLVYCICDEGDAILVEAPYWGT
jgi:aspartate/methionine/tyrosine aminotransferase